MKKKFLFVLFYFLLSSFFCFSQNSNLYGVKAVFTSSSSKSIQIDIFFEESINPKTLTFQNIFINDKPINENTKFIFNREGNQLRFIIDKLDSFSLQINHIKTNTGKTISCEKIYLNGDTQWKKS